MYADMLVAGNALTDYFLLRLCAAICRQPVRRGRMALAALAGGGASLLILIPSAMWAAVGALVAGALMCAIAFGSFRPRALVRQLLCLYALGFAWSGIWYALWFFLKPNGLYWHNGYVYFPISPPVFIVVTAVIYAALSLLRRICRSRQTARVIRFHLIGNGRAVCGQGLLDSGNLLTEPVSGLPVIVADRALVEPVFVPLSGVTDALSEPETARLAQRHFRFVHFDTLRGGGLLPACQLEGVISDDEPLRPASELYVAACADLRKNTGYDAIFPSSAFEHSTERVDSNA